MKHAGADENSERFRPRILFLTDPYPNYVPDLLLHGLREVLGGDVVDFPRKDTLYRGQLSGVCVEADCHEAAGSLAARSCPAPKRCAYEDGFAIGNGIGFCEHVE